MLLSTPRLVASMGGTILCTIAALTACTPFGPQAEPGEELSGGRATVFDTTANAFGHPLPGLPREQELLFFVGNSFFNQNWVAAPASTTARDGLGPVFNARSCAGCHFKDGRGRPADDGSAVAGLLVRLSVPGSAANGGPLPNPTYGDQIQDLALPGVVPEARITISYDEMEGRFADGTSYRLRRPTYTVTDPAFGPLPTDALLGPRVANQMIGLGLLEAVPEQTILANADPDDINRDGISGRPNWVWDAATQQQALGRFGWKANQPNIRQQTAGAFLGDIGITTSLFSQQNCLEAQEACLRSEAGGQPEIADDDLAKVVLYASTLAVPARRSHNDPLVLRGKHLFVEAGCSDCHLPTFQTGEHPMIPGLGGQTIRPYTDLLLHDMGLGLADGRPDFEASGSEWRTPPLWGIGLIETVNGHTFYLHDGRARNLMEAVLWHGGEAEPAQRRFITMSAAEREALLAFLRSL